MCMAILPGSLTVTVSALTVAHNDRPMKIEMSNFCMVIYYMLSKSYCDFNEYLSKYFSEWVDS